MHYHQSNGTNYHSNRQYNFATQQTPKSSLNGLPITTFNNGQVSLNTIDTPNRALASLRTPVRNQTPVNNQLYRPVPNISVNNNSFEMNTGQQFNGRQPTKSEHYSNPRQFNSVTDMRSPLKTKLNDNAGPFGQNTGGRHERDRTPNQSSNNFLSVQTKSPMKRGKSPLQVFIMDDKKDMARPSVTKPMDKEERLQRTIVMREAEITELRREVEALKQGTMNNIGGSMLVADNPVENYNRLKDEFQAVQFENQKLKEAMNKQERDFKKQLFDIKLKYEENARKNIEMMQRELVFQYANNDNEAIKVLKERIQQLESRR